MAQKRYVFDTFTCREARDINGKVVDIDWYYDPDTRTPPGRLSDVRVMALGHMLLLLADDEPGPPKEIPMHVVRTVEVHEE